MKIIYGLLLLFLIVMLILVLRFFTYDSLSTPKPKNIWNDEKIVEYDEGFEEEVSIDAQLSEMTNSTDTDGELDEVTQLLEKIIFEAIDINNLDFYTMMSSQIFFINQTEKQPYLEENQIYQGSLFRFPEYASYTVTQSSTEYDVNGQKLNDFKNKTDYMINNNAVYFTDEFDELNYFTFSKEDAFLETVGQLEKIARFFQSHKQFVTIYESHEKKYVSLNIPNELFIEHTDFFSETVFNGFFDTKTKEETEQAILEREQLNWPTKLYSHTITLVLTEDNKLESYYIAYESDAYGFDQNYRYHFKLMTSFFNINQVTIADEAQIDSAER